MNHTALGLLRCPICHLPLEAAQKTAVCPSGHHFDVAKEGYLNLLYWRGKRPKYLGDSKAMLKARRAFLEAGYYQPLLTKLAELCQPLQPQRLLEAGCGEGYYLGQLAAALKPKAALGVDIAKEGIRMAAKRYDNGRFLVADLNQFIPLADQAFDLLLNIFAPRNPAEFARLLQPEGWLLVVVPQPDHLASLRQPFGLLNIEPHKAATLLAQFEDAFTFVRAHALRFPLTLPGSDLLHLLQMMPSARHQTAVWPETIAQQPSWQTEAAFELLLWQKTAVS